MHQDARVPFLTFYLQSLAERTREEKQGTKFGFDWVIYNLALSEGWSPYRLPFIRGASNETSVTKTEPEFGVDLAFLAQDDRTLRIFVLKDEVLNNRNWGVNKFDMDLRYAAAPDMSGRGLENVKDVEVILAYNKDDDAAGVKLFENLTGALGTRIGDHVRLRFERWNLTMIVERVQEHLLTPSLLPQKFYSHFTYICAQFADFRHGSEEWVNQLIPNWRQFLRELLSEKSDDRSVKLLPVAIVILKEFGKENQSAETGIIDLIEWGMLAAWHLAITSPRKGVATAVSEVWELLYLSELERYYAEHEGELSIQYGLDDLVTGSFIDIIASGVVAHWHVARIGILAMSYGQLMERGTSEEQDKARSAAVTASDYIVGLLNANPSAMRPIIDLHHIELFLTWRCLVQVGRRGDIERWLTILVDRLTMRRNGLAQIPFIDGHNSVERVLEYVSTAERPQEFCDTSSTYLMCLLELCCSLPSERRDHMLMKVYHRLVEGCADGGEQMGDCEPINLMLWVPPVDWSERILSKSLSDEGECTLIRLEDIGQSGPSSGDDLFRRIVKLVAEMREKRPFPIAMNVPLPVVILACIKFRSPLPPEMWRIPVFGSSDQT